MNWTAWNSLAANADSSSPSAMPSSALPIASAPTAHGEPATSRPSTANATTLTTAAWTAAKPANAIPYPSRMSSLPSGIVSSRSSVPVVRSRRTVIEPTRNIEINGNRPTRPGPTRSNACGRASNT